MLNSEFAHFVNEHHDVMTEDFAERFVDHRGWGGTRNASDSNERLLVRIEPRIVP